ncbi:hypothetical protein Ancab_024871 [Ancistrocladus abbreviatus]
MPPPVKAAVALLPPPQTPTSNPVSELPYWNFLAAMGKLHSQRYRYQMMMVTVPQIAIAVKNDSQLEAAALVASIESLLDNDMANMNQIFLNKFNEVSAAEIWEVGQQLGIQSEDTNKAVTQCIAELDG